MCSVLCTYQTLPQQQQQRLVRMLPFSFRVAENKIFALNNHLEESLLGGGGGSWRPRTCGVASPVAPRQLSSGTPSAHYFTALGQWGVALLLLSASLPWGSGKRTPSTYCLSALGHWAVELLSYTTSLPCGNGTPSVHCLTALGQWAAELLLYSASVPWGGGQRKSFYTLPHRLGAASNCTCSVHGRTALGQWATPLAHGLTALGQWVVAFLLYIALIPRSIGQRNSVRSVTLGSGTAHCPKAMRL